MSNPLDQLVEAGRKVKFYKSKKFWTTVVVLPVLYFLLDGAVLSPLRQIPGHTTQLAKLERLPTDLDSFTKQTTTDFKTVDGRIDGLSKQVATLEGLPERMRLLGTDVATTKETVSESAKDTRGLSKALEVHAKRLDKTDATIAEVSSKLDQLKPIGEAVRDARGAIARLQPQGGKAPSEAPISTTVRVPLTTPPKTISASGKFKRAQIALSTDDIPILNQREKLSEIAITNAEIRVSNPPAVTRLSVEPHLNANDFRLELVVWLGERDEIPPTETEPYVLLTVSWPGR
jgi:hypothetical protein